MNKQAKDRDLQPERETPDGAYLTTNQGVRISHTDDSLKAGERGPTLMEDFHFREKMTHFDHERIPERVVHARGSAAHGVFRVYEPMAELTKARFLQDPNAETPVFVRFSTVVGFRGSADTVRDARGFAVKFYTEEGNFDLVGNNMPVFFIQDAIKFPDLVHAVKPEPHNEIPQASAAHDNFWDFISLMPESMHMIMWVLSDRALPRSYAMMEGFGVHTFRLVNAQGKARFVKFHWKPLLGVHSLVWDESQKIAGKDPDFNRRDLWEAIEQGNYPEFEFGIQIIEEEDEFAFDFDLLDPTKIWPEELVPVRRIGKMTLNRNPDNFFAETEQVAFHPGHLVPGIDFTNDPLLQGRLFSYLDTQLLRLGGPNFHEIPINRPVAAVHNNQRDGLHRHTINKGRTNYFPNSLGGGCPMTASGDMGGFVHYAERVAGHKVRARSESFQDHYSQARLFYASQSEIEKKHIVDAFHFELGKVMVREIRERMVAHLLRIDGGLARQVAERIGVKLENAEQQAPPERSNRSPVPPGLNGQHAGGNGAQGDGAQGDGAQGDGHAGSPASALRGRTVARSAALSMANTPKEKITGRKVAILVAAGYDHADLMAIKNALKAGGAQAKVVSKFLSPLKSADGQQTEVDESFTTTASVLFDAVYVPGGKESVDTLSKAGDALAFVAEAFKHCKPIAAAGEGIRLLREAQVQGMRLAEAGDKQGVVVDKGVVTAHAGAGASSFAQEFTQAIAQHRHWDREMVERVPA